MKCSAQALFRAVFILLRQETRAIPASTLSEPCLLLFAATAANTRSPRLYFLIPHNTPFKMKLAMYTLIVFSES